MSLLSIPDPEVCSTYYPSKEMPIEASHPLIQQYISQLASGENFDTIKANDSVIDPGMKSFDDKGVMVTLDISDVTKSSVGYIWKQLSDYPIVIGITKGMKSDHKPHYHAEAEAYYVVSGKGKTLCDNKYVWLEKGDYFYIPSNAIHNTPIVSDEGLSVLYWYPVSHTFSTFQYYWKENVVDSKKATEAFAIVDQLRIQFEIHKYFTEEDQPGSCFCTSPVRHDTETRKGSEFSKLHRKLSKIPLDYYESVDVEITDEILTSDVINKIDVHIDFKLEERVETPEAAESVVLSTLTIS